jgi:hypothetical protein
MTDMQNPGWGAGASRKCVVSWQSAQPTLIDRQAQLIVGRFGLPPCMARAVADLCFGGGSHE